MKQQHAVVLVPGGGGNSPYTTPEQECRSGFAAGGQLTALRSAFLEADIPAFTCPARVGGGVIEADDGWGGFADGPSPQPDDRTIDSVAPVSQSGEQLARFISLLAEEHGLTDLHVVGYSLGAVIARDAIGRMLGSAPRIHSLTSIGTPWLGSFAVRHAPEHLPLPKVIRDHVTSSIGEVRRGAVGDFAPSPGDLPWLRGYEGVLDGLALTRIAGTYFQAASTSAGEELETNDGVATKSSALGRSDSLVALPPAACFDLPDLHSAYLADLLELPWETALNWDPRVCVIVVDAVLQASHR